MRPQGAGHNWRTEHIHTHTHTHTQRKWVIWFNQLSAITEHLSHHKLIMFVTLWREILEIEIIYLPQWYFQTFSWEVFPCILRLISFNAKLRQYGQRRQWHPTPVLLPGKSYGRRSLVGCSPWGREVGHNWETSFSLSCVGEGNGNPLQCSCLENPRDGGAWWAAVYGVAQSQTRLKQLSSSSSSKAIW